jgi:protein-disulfide isomerase
MHDLLLEESPDLAPAQLLEYGKRLGLDEAVLKDNLFAMPHKPEIDADVKLAQDLDFYNTPTFLINGRAVIGNRPYSYLKKIVDEELTSASK